MSPSTVRVRLPSVIRTEVPRDTILRKGRTPINVYRPTFSPPSTDSSRKHSRSSAATRRKADTGVSRSAVIVR